MALPSSGAISFGSIGGEMGISAANSLSYLSQYAGNSTGYVPSGLTTSPYGMSEFFGFSFQNLSFSHAPEYANDPCGGSLNLYLGSNGLLYNGASSGSGTYTGYAYVYAYDNGNWWEWEHYVWYVYYISGGNSYYQYATNSSCNSFGFA